MRINDALVGVGVAVSKVEIIGVDEGDQAGRVAAIVPTGIRPSKSINE